MSSAAPIELRRATVDLKRRHTIDIPRVLGGFHVRESATLQRRLSSMNFLQESSFYRMPLEEGFLKGSREVFKEGFKNGFKQGFEIGFEKGYKNGYNLSLKVFHDMVIGQGERLLGPPDDATRALIESIDDLDRLKRTSLRVLSAKTWEDLVKES
jgi:hypothetical protein